MTVDPRTEAAAKAQYESGPTAEHWDMAQPAARLFHRERMETALAAADAVMFSEANIERAAKAYYEEYEAQPIYDEDLEEFTGHRKWEWLDDESQERYRKRVRFMVASLKGEA